MASSVHTVFTPGDAERIRLKLAGQTEDVENLLAELIRERACGSDVDALQLPCDADTVKLRDLGAPTVLLRLAGWLRRRPVARRLDLRGCTDRVAARSVG